MNNALCGLPMSKGKGIGTCLTRHWSQWAKAQAAFASGSTSCSVLPEVTDRCNLNCAVCFSDSGRGEAEDSSLEKITGLLERLRGCCISVVSPNGMLVPFCAYNLTGRERRSLCRQRNGSGS
jgi:uncharacterized radical SAM superfamily Fe-S cluster-containing enzyme